MLTINPTTGLTEKTTKGNELHFLHLADLANGRRLAAIKRAQRSVDGIDTRPNSLLKNYRKNNFSNQK